MQIETLMRDTLVRITDRVEPVTAALIAELETAEQTAQDATADFEQRFTVLQDAGAGLAAELEESALEIIERGTAAIEAASATRRRLETTVADGQAAFDDTEGQIGLLEQGIAALSPPAQATLTAVEDSTTELMSQMEALDHRLDATRQMTETYLNQDFMQLVEAVREQSLERATELVTYVDEEFVPEVVGQVEEFRSLIEEVKTRFEDKAQEIEQLTRVNTDELMQQVQRAFEEKFSVIIDRARSIDEYVEEVGESFESMADTVSQVNRIMNYGTSSTAIAARAAIGILDDLRELFDSIG